VSPAGNLYIQAATDGVIDRKDAMFFIRGNFLNGAVATTAMTKADEAWLPLILDSASEVSVSFKKAMPTPAGESDVTPTPMPLGKFLGWLEAAGMVRVAMHKHTYTRDSTQVHKYKVEAAEALCLQAKVKKGSGAMTLNMLSAWVSIPLLKECPHLQIAFCVNYDSNLNKLAVGVPGVYPLEPLRVRSNCIYKLF
jgi:hypothetical protein